MSDDDQARGERQSARLEIVRVNGSRTAEYFYTAFLARHPHAMLYYTLPYRDLIQAHLQCQADYFVAMDEDDEVRGILPTMTQDGPFGSVVNSLPFFGSHGGVLAETNEAASALWQHWAAIAAQAAAATAITNPFNEPVPYTLAGHDTAHIGQMTQLPQSSDSEAILAAMEPSAARNYRTALAHGIGVMRGDDQTWLLHDLHRESLAVVGGTIKSIAFFHAIPHHFRAGRDYRIYFATLGGHIIGALLMFQSGCCVEYFTPAVRTAYKALQPSALLLVAAMQDAIQAGVRLWNWGGTWASQTGVARFKTKWGGLPHPYRYLTRVNNPDILTADRAELLAAYRGFYLYPFPEDHDRPVLD